MQTLSINQRNKSVETNLAYLPIEDKNYLDTVFEIYYSHVSHVSELLQLIENRNFQYLNNRNAETDKHFFSLLDIDKAKTTLRDTLETLTQSLVLKFEIYFANKYCLDFKSLIPDTGKTNLDPLLSYDLIVSNIIQQVGTDFFQAGKEQIKTRFLKCFSHNRLPVLKGDKITIPRFISLDEHFGTRISLNYCYNETVENLLNALNLFLNDSTELPESIKAKLIEWKSKLDLSHQYNVFPEVSFKFFKNQRLDVLFTNATTARKFWNYYTLEIIEKIIHEND